MRFTKEDKVTYLPIESIIHTFLHELSHTITLPEARPSNMISSKEKKLQPNVKNKKNKGYIAYHHNESFYSNFAIILRAAEALNIFKLLKMYHNFDSRNLKRFDTMFNPSDGISMGTSKLSIKYTSH